MSGTTLKHPPLGGFQHFPIILHSQTPCCSGVGLLLHITGNPTPRLSQGALSHPPPIQPPGQEVCGLRLVLRILSLSPAKCLSRRWAQETEEEGRVLP